MGGITMQKQTTPTESFAKDALNKGAKALKEGVAAVNRPVEDVVSTPTVEDIKVPRVPHYAASWMKTEVPALGWRGSRAHRAGCAVMFTVPNFEEVNHVRERASAKQKDIIAQDVISSKLCEGLFHRPEDVEVVHKLYTIPGTLAEPNQAALRHILDAVVVQNKEGLKDMLQAKAPGNKEKAILCAIIKEFGSIEMIEQLGSKDAAELDGKELQNAVKKIIEVGSAKLSPKQVEKLYTALLVVGEYQVRVSSSKGEEPRAKEAKK